MAARAYWSGQIRLALVSIPVEVFSATKSGAQIRFNQVHQPSGKRIAYEKVVPGIGPITASAIAATVPDVSIFRSGRQFAAWLGLTPRPHSSGGKERLGGITKQGDGYLRRLLVVGATAVMRMTRKDHARQPWLAKLLMKKPAKLASVALANKTARIAWVIMSRGEIYRPAVA